MFADTVTQRIAPYSATQRATAMPDRIWPVFVGSGSLVLGLDATGMQGLGNRAQAAFHASDEAADLYAVGHGRVGNTLNPNNTIPYGWFDYTITIDGEPYDAARILRDGALFCRTGDVYRGIVTTSFILDAKLRVEWTAFAPYGSESVVFELKTESYDPYAASTDVRHEIGAEVKFHLTTRRGAPIYDRAEYSAEKDFVRTEVTGMRRTAAKSAAARRRRSRRVLPTTV